MPPSSRRKSQFKPWVTALTSLPVPRRSPRRRFGVLLALSFPDLRSSGGCLGGARAASRRAGAGVSAARALCSASSTGVVYFAGTLYWITRVMAVYGGLAAVRGVLVNALLVAYLALFPALFALS